MNAKQFLDQVAYTKNKICLEEEITEYRTKHDDSYITLVGMEDNIKFLADREITEQLSHGLGFSPADGKWYGWSHRAIFGFEIGSACSKGDCHYVASTPEELIDDHVNFMDYTDEEKIKQKRAECQVLDNRSGIRILTTPIAIKVARDTDALLNALDNDSIGSLPEEQIFKNDFYVIDCGRGEWVAKTMDDAKQMAKDFSAGVS